MSTSQEAGASLSAAPVSVPVLFGSLLAIGLLNGLSETIAASIGRWGPVGALAETFGTSAFVWLAIAAGLTLVYRSPPLRIDRRDRTLAAGVALAMLPPVPALSWFAVTVLALYLIVRSPPGSQARRGALILLAATIPGFWARVLLSVFNDTILAIDAFLVSLAVGAGRQGNLVPFADGSGALWIAPGCSSLTNVSLALLTFVVLVNITSGKWTSSRLGLCALACAAVVAINVTRISLIGYFPAQYELFHGEIGAGIAGGLTTLAILAIGWLAVRHDAITLG